MKELLTYKACVNHLTISQRGCSCNSPHLRILSAQRNTNENHQMVPCNFRTTYKCLASRDSVTQCTLL